MVVDGGIDIQMKKVLIFGAGMMAKPVADYLMDVCNEINYLAPYLRIRLFTSQRLISSYREQPSSALSAPFHLHGIHPDHKLQF